MKKLSMISLIGLGLLSSDLWAHKVERAKTFECRINPESFRSQSQSRCVKLNLSGKLLKLKGEENLYNLHELTGNYIWDLSSGGDCPDRVSVSSAWSSGYLTNQILLENDVDYRPKSSRYQNTIKFDLPFRDGSFDLMVSKNILEEGIVEFQSYVIGSNVADHDGGSVALDCESRELFAPLSDHVLDYTDSTILGEKGQEIRRQFRKGKTNFKTTRLWLEEDTQWLCDTYQIGIFKLLEKKDVPLAINFKEKTAKGFVDGPLLGRYQLISRDGLHSFRRSLSRDGIYDLYIETKIKDDWNRGFRNGKGINAVANPSDTAVGYAKCRSVIL